MNKPLIGFAVLLIFGGFIVGINLLIVLGVLLLIPGLATTPRQQSRVPVSKSQPPRRVAPPSTAPLSQMQYPPATPAQAPPSPPMSVSMSPPSGGAGPVFSPPLFPNSIFPTLSLPSTYAAQGPPPKEGQTAKTDELLEVGALVALLKLAFG